MNHKKIINMKIKIYFLIIAFFSTSICYSSYKLERKEINETNKDKNYTISVIYHQIDGFRDKSVQENCNKYIYDMVNRPVKDFRRDMKGWLAMDSYPSEFEIRDTIFITNENIISIRFDGYQYYSGSAHPTTFFISANYNLNDDEPIKFSDIFTGNYLNKISDYCIQDLTRQGNAYSDNPDINWIKAGAAPKEDNFEVFNVLESSILITFPALQVASYAEGPKEVNIPNSELIKFIDKSGPLGYLFN